MVRLGQGYSTALKHYESQKQNFLNSIAAQLSEENSQNISELEEMVLDVDSSCKDEALNNIVAKIQDIINNSQDIKDISNWLSQKYSALDIKKKEINKEIDKEMQKVFQEDWFQTQVMSKMNNMEQQLLSESALNDSFVRGRILMLFHQAMRHNGILAPGNYTRSQLSGLLYEHALVGAFKDFFKTKGSLSDVIEITPIGAKGGKGDIAFKFHPELLSGNGQDSSDFIIHEVSVKLTELEHILTSEEHGEKLRVGGGKETFGEDELKTVHSVQDSIYFLSKKDNVIKAIGPNTTMYGLANGRIKFTSDLINNLHYKRHYVLAMNSPSTKNYYISWINQKL